MYYLKCTNCGHLNEVISGALSTCSSCNQALTNSFLEWSKVNAGKTFEQYKKEVCIAGETAETPAPKKASTKSTVIRVVTVIGILLVAVIVKIGIPVASVWGVKWFATSKTSSEVLTKDWVKDSYGLGLTVETPNKLTKSDVPLADNVKQLIAVMNTYSSSGDKGFQISVNTVKYMPNAPEISLQGGANGAVNNMKTSTGVTDFNYTEEHTMTADSIPCITQKGTFKTNSIPCEFVNVMYGKGPELWEILVIYQSDDEVGKAAVKRIISSIVLKPDEIRA